MIKICGEYSKLCRAEGVILLGLDLSRTHCCLEFKRGFIFAAKTPSDMRNMKHVRSAIRRLHR